MTEASLSYRVYEVNKLHMWFNVEASELWILNNSLLILLTNYLLNKI